MISGDVARQLVYVVLCVWRLSGVSPLQWITGLLEGLRPFTGGKRGYGLLRTRLWMEMRDRGGERGRERLFLSRPTILGQRPLLGEP